MNVYLFSERNLHPMISLLTVRDVMKSMRSKASKFGANRNKFFIYTFVVS
jgi:hypothetical protein